MAVREAADERTALLADQNGRADRPGEQLQPGVLHERNRSGDGNPQHVGLARGLLITFSLYGLIFLCATNMSLMTTIQSTVAEELDAFESANWFTSVYLITLSSVSPLAARLAYIFSVRLCISTASLFFAVGALVTSQATGLASFLMGRCISGLGAAGCMMTVFTFVLELAGKKRRGLFIGLVNTAFTSGVALGAVIAGALLPVAGWRFIFRSQFPLALLAGTGILLSAPTTFSATKKLEKMSFRSKLAKVDYLGAVTLIIGMSLLLSGFATSTILWIPIVISPLFIVAFVYIELRVATDPVIPVAMLKSRGLLLSWVAQLGMMMARWLVFLYGPVYAIAVRNLTPATAGSLLVPTNICMAAGSLLIGWLHVRKGGDYWLSTVLSFFAFGCTIIIISQLSLPATPVSIYITAVALNGVAAAGVVTYTPIHLLHLCDPQNHAFALGLLTNARGFAGSFASAIGGGLFLRMLKGSLERGFRNSGLVYEPDLIRKLLGSPAMVQELAGEEKLIAMHGYEYSLKMIFLFGGGLGLLMAIVQAGTGWKGYDDQGEIRADEETGSIGGA